MTGPGPFFSTISEASRHNGKLRRERLARLDHDEPGKLSLVVEIKRVRWPGLRLDADQRRARRERGVNHREIVSLAINEFDFLAQIGRASCRERGESFEVGVSVKKKRKTTCRSAKKTPACGIPHRFITVQYN